MEGHPCDSPGCLSLKGKDLAKSTELAASGVYSLFLSEQHVLVYELKIKGNLTCILLYFYIQERKGRRPCRSLV